MKPRRAGVSDPHRIVESVAHPHGLEPERHEVTYAEAPRFVRSKDPILVLPAGQRYLTGLPGRAPRRQARELCRRLRAAAEAQATAAVDDLLDAAEVHGRRRRRARAALLHARLRDQPVATAWLLRPAPGGSIRPALRRSRLITRVVAFAGVHAAQYVLWLLSFAVVGDAAIEGEAGSDTVLTWALLLAAVVPVRMLAIWLQGRISIEGGRLLKRRLLEGALRLDAEEVRHLGAGQFLGRVLESEAIETLAVTGALLGLAALVELALAFPVLLAGAAPAGHAIALAGWAVLAAALIRRYVVRRARWTAARLAITHDLVERMVGHRTRLAQQAAPHRTAGEDEALGGYFERSRRADGAEALVAGVTARGWLLLGVLVLVPGLLTGTTSPAQLAISLGGVLLALGALSRLTAAASDLADVAIAWRQVSLLLRAACRPELTVARPHTFDGDGAGPLMEASGLSFDRPGRGPVLRGASIRIGRGDRILLEGPSGSGKSTLASIIAGLRLPDRGCILLGGQPPEEVGSRSWRRRVTVAPQFHENHLVLGSLAFNVLMGRRWPPRPEDLAEAEDVCRALGLGDLLERMPSGLQQIVGETGWQLSHGERSLVFIARTLLAEPELVVLDESFGALDPQLLRRSLDCVLERSPALLVIAQ